MKPQIPPQADPAHEMFRQVDAHGVTLADSELHQMSAALETLARQAVHFPIHDCRALVERNTRSNDFSVKITLQLTGRTLVVSEHAPAVVTAFDQGVRSLERQIEEYKASLGQISQRQKHSDGTHLLLQPSLDPDQALLDRASEEGDYNKFRTALFGYEDAVRNVAGRHLDGHPEWDAQVHKRFQIGDVVEEVFLDAFEQYDKRPREVRFGEWLTHLIDPAVKELMQHTDAALENIRMARSARNSVTGDTVS